MNTLSTNTDAFSCNGSLKWLRSHTVFSKWGLWCVNALTKLQEMINVVTVLIDFEKKGKWKALGKT